MTKCWIIIVSNLIFILLSIPFITTGAAWSALLFVMFKMLREGDVAPVREFLRAFKEDLFPGIISFLFLAAAGAIIVFEIYVCRNAAGYMVLLQFPLYGLTAMLIIYAIHLFAVIAVFSDKLLQAMKNSLFFTTRRPWKGILLLAVYVIPMTITIFSVKYQPLYAFIWFMCGFSLLALFTAAILHDEFREFF